jgi:predicted amidohydrolase YtcJ
MERLAPAARWKPLRVRIEHSKDLRGEKLRRAVALGIVVAQPRPTAPLREMLDAGLTVAYGSDIGFAPFVAFQSMTSAANPQAISREEALHVLTGAGALAELAETEKGRIQPGMLADLTVLTQNVLTAAEAELPTTRSLLTIVGGRIAYRAPEF